MPVFWVLWSWQEQSQREGEVLQSPGGGHPSAWWVCFLSSASRRRRCAQEGAVRVHLVHVSWSAVLEHWRRQMFVSFNIVVQSCCEYSLCLIVLWMRLYCFCIRESSCVYLKQLKRAVGEDGPIGFPLSVLPLRGLEGSALCNNWRQSRFVLPLCVSVKSRVHLVWILALNLAQQQLEGRDGEAPPGDSAGFG